MHYIVILGAGYGGLRTTLKLSELISQHKEVSIVLINKHNYHMLMTQLHETATGTSKAEDLMVPIERVLEGKGITFIKGWVDDISLEQRHIVIDNGTRIIPFKYLVIALGSEPEYYDIPGLKENSMCLRSLYSSLEIRRQIDRLIADYTKNTLEGNKEPLTFVIGGGGLTGVEFAGELSYHLRHMSKQSGLIPRDYKIIMVEGSKELLPGSPEDISAYSLSALEESGVEVITGDFIKEVSKTAIALASGRSLNYSMLIWAGGVRGNNILARSSLKTDSKGRVPVNQYLQYIEDPFVYLVGDNALAVNPTSGKPVLPTAQAALQQGELVANNIYADLFGKEKRIYHPSSLGTIISIGRKKGVGEIKSIKLRGTTASLLKSVIPRKYLYSIGGFKMLSPDLRGNTIDQSNPKLL
ncbi:NAD(P)/FAD-dependent oxidoreductase [Desulforamulus aquiferis]|uniref:NADH:ubiquinone reductase (non-electrogenic) n=1 Tax=Desulforamulus aquiferis TaxID=1397668 RepID=A0AAW7Z9T9_9FIRM|nr:NAD(P)/FAD-dependent oxidoreductase [Desulforamulus aquiferis]MDO7786230.1 NAD(P)/FAD-dependent oxidoreductase [Desulforamulus aquiferis]RYD04677.1 hypothetical protein N752_14995 [Desulforamulus aquiferis]